jgi:O-antigen/teichoic acid export membrane protein
MSLRVNSIANLAGRFVTAVLWVVATPFVYRQLGVERFGIWSLFFAFNAYLLSFDLGVGRTMVRFVAALRGTGNRHALVKTIVWGTWAALGMGLVWAIAMEFARGWISHAFHVPPGLLTEAFDALLIFALGVVIMFPAQSLMATLQGFERIDLSNLCMSLGVLVHVALLYFALKAGYGLRGAAMASAAGQLVSGVVAAVLLRGPIRGVQQRENVEPPRWREMMNFSVALQVLGVLIMLQIQSGRLVLGLMGNLAMVADYELAFRVASAIGGLPILIRDPIIPTISRVWDGEDPNTVRPLFTHSSWWTYTSSAIFLGVLWLTADDAIRVWLGPGHERIADLVRLWVLAYAANLAYAPGVALARGMGLLTFEIWSYAAALATSVGLAVLWVPHQGTIGAVRAVAISYCVGLLVFMGLFHRPGWFFPFWSWFRRDFLPPVLAGCIAVAACELVRAIPRVAAVMPPVGLVRGAILTVLYLGLLGGLLLIARTFALRPRATAP